MNVVQLSAQTAANTRIKSIEAKNKLNNEKKRKQDLLDNEKRKKKRNEINDVDLEDDSEDDDEDDEGLGSDPAIDQHLGDSNSAIGGKLKVGAMNELQKYKEIQRRTKLLYGVKDVKRMIDKSDASKHFYQRDITYINFLKAE